MLPGSGPTPGRARHPAALSARSTSSRARNAPWTAHYFGTTAAPSNARMGTQPPSTEATTRTAAFAEPSTGDHFVSRDEPTRISMRRCRAVRSRRSPTESCRAPPSTGTWFPLEPVDQPSSSSRPASIGAIPEVGQRVPDGLRSCADNDPSGLADRCAVISVHAGPPDSGARCSRSAVSLASPAPRRTADTPMPSLGASGPTDRPSSAQAQREVMASPPCRVREVSPAGRETRRCRASPRAFTGGHVARTFPAPGRQDHAVEGDPAMVHRHELEALG